MMSRPPILHRRRAGGGDPVNSPPRPSPPPSDEQSPGSQSPFERPDVMTGYPLSPDEQKRVDRLVEEASRQERREE